MLLALIAIPHVLFELVKLGRNNRGHNEVTDQEVKANFYSQEQRPRRKRRSAWSSKLHWATENPKGINVLDV